MSFQTCLGNLNTSLSGPPRRPDCLLKTVHVTTPQYQRVTPFAWYLVAVVQQGGRSDGWSGAVGVGFKNE